MMNISSIGKQLRSYAADDASWLPVFANAASLIIQNIPSVKWVGFYIVTKNSLLLGPFQGMPARGRIMMGEGVCGTAAKDDIVQRIKNVHLYPGHIACDPKANSELVLPIHHEGRVVAVLDMDSPLYDRFSEEDQKKMEDFVNVLEEITDFSSIEI